jgi:hypothetical protein
MTGSSREFLINFKGDGLKYPTHLRLGEDDWLLERVSNKF